METVLREGVTTGSCAAAAALGSVLWQLEGQCPQWVKIRTPSGRELRLELLPLHEGACGVIKDAGDDPDVTDGCMVIAQVTLGSANAPAATGGAGTVTFKAGEGVGTVTLPGLKVAVGEPAINPVPRQMIIDAIRPYLHGRSACVTISIPGGEKLAKKTFNSRVGVAGGLSVLGTSGIVRPMSETAMKESLALELNVRARQAPQGLVFVFGAQGEAAARALFGEAICCVMASNYIGFMLDEAAKLGIVRIAVAGFAGKLVKLAADIMNTHSHVADGRRETLCTFAALAGAPQQLIRRIYESATVNAAMALIDKSGYRHIWADIAQTAAKKCCMRVHDQIDVAVVLIDQDRKILGQSRNAEKVLDEIRTKHGQAG